jgi:hypothetical protein
MLLLRVTAPASTERPSAGDPEDACSGVAARAAVAKRPSFRKVRRLRS